MGWRPPITSAKLHGMTNIAVIEKGWIGGGNSGRNTTIVRSNYLFDESAAIYGHALKLWNGLGRELDYNIMMSHRGVLNLRHDETEARQLKRRVDANRLNGVDAEWLEPEDIKAFCPPISLAPTNRYPVIGATLQRSGGTNRHDAVVWGYARAADRMGVDIIQQCEVVDILTENGAVTGVETTKGTDPYREGRLRRRRPYQRCGQDGGREAAHREPSAAGAGLRAGQAGHPLRDHVQRRARLCQPVRQGRAGHRRRHRPVHFLHAARLARHHRAPDGVADRAVPFRLAASG
jgi:hypothetical protein